MAGHHQHSHHSTSRCAARRILEQHLTCCLLFPAAFLPLPCCPPPGDNAEIGKINKLVSQVENVKTNLLVQMEILGRWLAIIVLLIAIGAFLLALLHAHEPFAEAFKSAVAIAVAMIPEGLPALVTIVLALGTTKMAEHHAIIRQLPCVGEHCSNMAVDRLAPVVVLGGVVAVWVGRRKQLPQAICERAMRHLNWQLSCAGSSLALARQLLVVPAQQMCCDQSSSVTAPPYPVPPGGQQHPNTVSAASALPCYPAAPVLHAPRRDPGQSHRHLQ